MKNTKATQPYIIPIFLWSTVKSHSRQPVVLTGRRTAPSDPDGEIDNGLLTKPGD